jgi:hypothetical protein
MVCMCQMYKVSYLFYDTMYMFYTRVGGIVNTV